MPTSHIRKLFFFFVRTYHNQILLFLDKKAVAATGRIIPSEIINLIFDERTTHSFDELLQSEATIRQQMIRMIKKVLFQQNQFINFNSDAEQLLDTIFHDFLQRTMEILQLALSKDNFEADFQELFKSHLLRLQEFVAKFWEQDTTFSMDRDIVRKNPACHEYSSDFQLNLLAINLSELTEPVVDIGCGYHGYLINNLRAAGINAVGFDRMTRNSKYLIEHDWLEFDFPEDSFGTIISHMGFSHHFLFHHLYKNGSPDIYAHKFIEILTSLKTNGSFYYAPGLPFIEEFLPADKFLIINTPIEISAGKALHEKLDDSYSHATRVVKLQ